MIPRTLLELRAQQEASALRKSKRAAKAATLWPTPAPDGSKSLKNGPRTAVRAKKTRRPPSRRKLAFKRLWNACRTFVLLRCKARNGGLCEVALLCGGRALAEVAYHIFAAANGNAIKYDVRNLVGACSRCNGAEYFARKRGNYGAFEARHRTILGDPLYNELNSLKGRKPISTVEAEEMAANVEHLIEQGAWK